MFMTSLKGNSCLNMAHVIKLHVAQSYEGFMVCATVTDGYDYELEGSFVDVEAAKQRLAEIAVVANQNPVITEETDGQNTEVDRAARP